ncbi:tryptophan-rich sensory protein [Bizionia gelidisalsuginis]|uniref:Tryptophan-rich sensory protein n=1 Tax=Bizionia gelidisalsuginis TaxID=291188 RepID=A0ABY3M8Q1_9FLAO|nr:TspO/MBR family protein [Bizionia gelidisalsuginis]TYC10576.1 tryptophan-rich sensory protein [Bizionia gelidisalsuginis]
MIYRLIIFLVLNFTALGVGGLLAGKGASSVWYASINKAPWTPPGWVFGAAWVTIMICFSIYLAYLWPTTENKTLLIGLLVIQYLFNIAWNPIFFRYHNISLGLFVIIGLTLIVGFILFYYWSILKLKSILLLPYFIWLLIATSLNMYAFLKN